MEPFRSRVERNPLKFAVFVIDYNRRLGIHEADGDWQHTDGIAVSLIELFANVCGIETIALQAGFFLDLT